MTLRPGCRLSVAPRFHMPADWSRRLSIAHGFDLAGENIYPRLPWRSATNDEIGLLTIGSDESPMSVDDCVWLFHLPGHLLTAWWSLLERAAGDQAIGNFPGVDAFAREVGEFLTFKGVPMPDEMRVDVVFNELGTVFAPWDRNGQRSEGLSCNVASSTPWPFAEGDRRPRLWGGINLGDSEISLVLINLTCRQLDAELRQRRPSEPPPSEIGKLVRQYLRACPDYPPVRLMLAPGEGFYLPPGGLVLGSNSGTEQEPAVLLSIVDDPARLRS